MAAPNSRLDFPQAMQAIAFANQIVEQFDWDELHRVLSDADGMLCFRDPTLFMQWQRDPQRQMKIDAVAAAHAFAAAIAKIKIEAAE